jgi:hypothetical protein
VAATFAASNGRRVELAPGSEFAAFKTFYREDRLLQRAAVQLKTCIDAPLPAFIRLWRVKPYTPGLLDASSLPASSPALPTAKTQNVSSIGTVTAVAASVSNSFSARAKHMGVLAGQDFFAGPATYANYTRRDSQVLHAPTAVEGASTHGDQQPTTAYELNGKRPPPLDDELVVTPLSRDASHKRPRSQSNTNDHLTTGVELHVITSPQELADFVYRNLEQVQRDKIVAVKVRDDQVTRRMGSH